MSVNFTLTIKIMNMKNEIKIDGDIVVCDISRSVRRGSMFVGASFIVGALILGASVTGSWSVRVTLFTIAVIIVALWATYVVIRFCLNQMAARKRSRESAIIGQSLSGRLTVSRTGTVSPAKDVEDNPIPVKNRS